MTELTGKVAFITGAAGGIGLGIARAFAEVGGRVAVADIDEAVLAESAAELAESGAEVVAVPLDVTDRDSWAAAVESVHAKLGLVQVLVNNAGVSTNGMRFDEVSPRVWDRVVEINLTGVYNGVHNFLPDLRAAGGGHIVSTSSMGGLMGLPALSPYSATKAAVIALSEALHAELADDGIGVSVLCPGGVRSRLWRTSRAIKGLPDTDVPPDDQSGQSATASMLPDEVGRRVVDGVLSDELYIFTHPEMRGWVAEREERIRRGFDRAEAFSG
ncbi:NAD(P)-dependent dehydrogenase (short-subunit alcohol dehydrogenase family) [Kibdelosporangium banguiense]|uniref:NAD(P)-dependent dehydrogenase (Short-subunit alcohol dehydrogenase family) n=1 Tax=Kibdelosporangium banguiense TaxID=1365924 RepID=A0ABS4TY57_9PSEU|nr:SDR family oxidoreductase [Kibdelosporangium banguiense]MBP2328943.1 NAD(P)-dependent dehydrogenase (short-subunit alcohol dehydrogenase family) [Kibdelosporangium banguiense]